MLGELTLGGGRTFLVTLREGIGVAMPRRESADLVVRNRKDVASETEKHENLESE